MSPNPLLEIHDLSVMRRGQTVLTLDHLAVEGGEVLALIGPNGAGKSTLLLVISKLLEPSKGKILFNGEAVHPKKEHDYRQQLALVLQEPLLLDASVYENVAIGLKFRRVSKREIQRRVLFWLERLGIAHLKDRAARQLSGGESQRVSLARALALEPDLLLLDEPFSALDAPTRTRLLDDFQAILNEINITTVFVTHDLNEALLLGDRVAVLLDGRMEQLDKPQVVFNAPANPEVAAFVGVESLIPGEVAARDTGMLHITVNGFELEAVGEVDVGRNVFLMVRPENITIWRREEVPASSARNMISGNITRLSPQGPLVRVTLDCGFPLVVLVTRSSMEEMPLKIGQWVQASFKASAVHVIPR
jgi:tungstate transport system ATP-binding protein